MSEIIIDRSISYTVIVIFKKLKPMNLIRSNVKMIMKRELHWSIVCKLAALLTLDTYKKKLAIHAFSNSLLNYFDTRNL